MRILVLLCKAFVILAVYPAAWIFLSMWWAANRREMGIDAAAIAVFTATTGSGVILLARKGNIGSIMFTAIGGLVGGFGGCDCLGPLLVIAGPIQGGHGESKEFMATGSWIGTIAGGFLASSWFHWREERRRTKEPSTESSGWTDP